MARDPASNAAYEHAGTTVWFIVNQRSGAQTDARIWDSFDGKPRPDGSFDQVGAYTTDTLPPDPSRAVVGSQRAWPRSEYYSSDPFVMPGIG